MGEKFLARIIPVQGDLNQPQLGLADNVFNELTHHIDSIYHNGALVHHLQTYKHLKVSNVDATRDILRLATLVKNKPVHYTSSLSVLPTQPLAGKSKILENDPLHWYPIPKGTYNRTKWVAEQLVSEAGRRGLDITIHRPGPVSGDSVTGAYNNADILCMIMRGYIELGFAPAGNLPLDMLPVDYLTKLMVYLSLQKSSIGKTFHHIHTQPISSSVLFKICAKEGIKVHQIPYREWHQHLLALAKHDTNHPLYPLVALFATRNFDENNSFDESADPDSVDLPFDTSQMQSARVNAPFKQPELNNELLTTYLRALAKNTRLNIEQPA